MIATKKYPLQWPPTQKRTAPTDLREASYTTSKGGSSKARLSIDQAARRLGDELRRLGVATAVVTSDYPLRRDGELRLDRGEPKSSAVAVYFDFDGREQCIAVDCWNRVADNVAAVAKAIECLRGLERIGGGRMVSAAFTGFAALPAPGGSSTDPQTVEQAAEFVAVACGGKDATAVLILSDAAAYVEHKRTAIKRYHPDRYGGTAPPEWHQLQSATRLLDKHHGGI